jgi:hypothetical protein
MLEFVVKRGRREDWVGIGEGVRLGFRNAQRGGC